VTDNVEYRLNKKQSILIALLAETKTAEQIRLEVIEIIAAWRCWLSCAEIVRARRQSGGRQTLRNCNPILSGIFDFPYF
jgi:hypothetical protein